MSKALKDRLNKPFGIAAHNLRAISFKEPVLTPILEKKNSMCWNDDDDDNYRRSKLPPIAEIDIPIVSVTIDKIEAALAPIT